MSWFFFSWILPNFLKPATRKLRALRGPLDCPTISPHLTYLLQQPNLRPELRNLVRISSLTNFILYFAPVFLSVHILAGSNLSGASSIAFTLSPASLPDSDESDQEARLNSTENQFLDDVLPEREGKLYLLFYQWSIPNPRLDLPEEPNSDGNELEDSEQDTDGEEEDNACILFVFDNLTYSFRIYFLFF